MKMNRLKCPCHFFHLFILSTLRETLGTCISADWKQGQSTKTCFKFVNETHDYMSAARVCHEHGGEIPLLTPSQSKDIISLFAIDLPFHFWTVDTNNNNNSEMFSYSNSSRNGSIEYSNEIKYTSNCYVMSVKGNYTVIKESQNCQMMSGTVCEFNQVRLPDNLIIIQQGGKTVVFLETKDYVAIAIGSTIAVIFCGLVINDIIRHNKCHNEPTNYKMNPDSSFLYTDHLGKPRVPLRYTTNHSTA